MNSLSAPRSGLIANVRPLEGLSNDFLSAWEALARNSIEPNPFLLPQFILSLDQHLSQESSPSLWTVEKPDGELVLLTVLLPVGASSQILFPHLNDKISTYQFQGGMLLDRRMPRAALISFLEYLKTTRYRHGMVFSSICIDSPFSEQLYTAAVLTGFQVQLHGTWSRASLKLDEFDRQSSLLETYVSKNRRKSLRRSRGKLERHGAVQFRVIEQCDEVPAAVDRFLNLEQQGWKRESGTAMGCDARHKAFFETFASRMAEAGKILFGELLVGDRVIASTCNLIDGDTLFAFKIGWDSEFREGSPGAWAEIELAEWIAKEKPDIALLNSCSTAGSYLDRLWTHRLAMGNVILTQSHRAVLYSSVRRTLRTAKRMFWPGGNSQVGSAE